MNMSNAQYIAIDPADGRHLRPATQTEVARYLAQWCVAACFRKAIRVGGVLVDEFSGPGGIQCWPNGDWLE